MRVTVCDEDNNVTLAYSLYIYPLTDLLNKYSLKTFNVLGQLRVLGT